MVGATVLDQDESTVYPRDEEPAKVVVTWADTVRFWAEPPDGRLLA